MWSNGPGRIINRTFLLSGTMILQIYCFTILMLISIPTIGAIVSLYMARLEEKHPDLSNNTKSMYIVFVIVISTLLVVGMLFLPFYFAGTFS